MNCIFTVCMEESNDRLRNMNSYSHTYRIYIQSFWTDALFVSTTLTRLEHAGLIKLLKEIILEGSWLRDECQAFYQCALALKNTLQRMKLNSVGKTISSVDGRIGSIVNFLYDFTALTTLEIKNHRHGSTSISPQLSMFPILRYCSNLVRFSWINDFNEPEEDIRDYTFKHNNLKYLELSLPEITKHHVKYMITNITQLKEFRFHSEESIRWVDDIDADDLNSFLKYLVKVDHVLFLTSGNFKRSIREQWVFVSGIVGNNKSIPIHISFNMNDHDTIVSDRTMLLKSSEKINFHFEMNAVDFYQFARISTLPKLLQAAFAPTEFSGDNIQSFHVRIRTNLTRDRMYKFAIDMFKSVFNSFNSLCDVTLETGNQYESHFNIRAASREIDDTVVDKVTYDLLIPLTHRPALPSEQLTYTKLEKLQSVEEIRSTLNFFPNTKYLILNGCKLNLDGFFNVNLNLNNLQLKRLTVDIASLLKETSLKTIVLQINEEETNQVSCFKWKKERKEFSEIVFKPVHLSYLTKYGRYASSRFNAILIKCHRLEQITLYVDNESGDNTISDIVNIEHNSADNMEHNSDDNMEHSIDGSMMSLVYDE